LLSCDAVIIPHSTHYLWELTRQSGWVYNIA